MIVFVIGIQEVRNIEIICSVRVGVHGWSLLLLCLYLAELFYMRLESGHTLLSMRKVVALNSGMFDDTFIGTEQVQLTNLSNLRNEYEQPNPSSSCISESW